MENKYALVRKIIPAEGSNNPWYDLPVVFSSREQCLYEMEMMIEKGNYKREDFSLWKLCEAIEVLGE